MWRFASKKKDTCFGFKNVFFNEISGLSKRPKQPNVEEIEKLQFYFRFQIAAKMFCNKTV